MSSASQGLNSMGTGQPVALISHQRRFESRRIFRERESNLEVTNRFSDSLTQQMLLSLFLIEIEITCLLKQDPS